MFAMNFPYLRGASIDALPLPSWVRYFRSAAHRMIEWLVFLAVAQLCVRIALEC